MSQYTTLFAVIAAALATVAGVATLVVSWIVSARVEREAFRPAPRRPSAEAQVVEVDGLHLRLRRNGRRELRAAGSWGFAFPGGYTRLSEGASAPDGTARFRFEAVAGAPAAGDVGRFDASAFPDEHSELERTTIESSIGPLPAQIRYGDPGRWVVLVHGQSGGMREVYRLEQVARRSGATTLVVSYRNDPGTPPSADGYFHFGRSEWRDLEAAVSHAVACGAEDIVLTGHSMGAAIVIRFMESSSLTGVLRGIVLDAPLLDLNAAAAWTARTTGVPRLIIPIALRIAARRLRFAWRDYDARDPALRLNVPMLVFHGERDGQVPLALSEALARARPDAIHLERISGAGHGQSWNLDPARYEQVAADFFSAHLVKQHARPE